jgi:hypothetical protein
MDYLNCSILGEYGSLFQIRGEIPVEAFDGYLYKSR